MNWPHYRESQGAWQREVVLSFDPADKADPFLKRRIEQYRDSGMQVRLRPHEPGAANPTSNRKGRAA